MEIWKRTYEDGSTLDKSSPPSYIFSADYVFSNNKQRTGDKSPSMNSAKKTFVSCFLFSGNAEKALT
jgi:hypothetical protein